jgi:hypothetical protein
MSLCFLPLAFGVFERVCFLTRIRSMITGFKRECVARKYLRFQCRNAHHLRR